MALRLAGCLKGQSLVALLCLLIPTTAEMQGQQIDSQQTFCCVESWQVQSRGATHLAGAVSVPQRPFFALLQTAHLPLVVCIPCS